MLDEAPSAATQLTELLLSQAEVTRLALGPALGEGEASRVYAGRFRGHRVAIKCGKPGMDEVLLREAQALALAAGPSVPFLHGVGRASDTGSVRLVMELCAGPSVASTCRRELSPAERLELCERVFVACAPALLQLHALGWAHGDVKPENLCERGAQDRRVVLLDFGLASQETQVTSGTPRYLPPEVLKGEPVSPLQADSYALFLTLGEILDPSLELVDGGTVTSIPEAWRELLVTALRGSPSGRPSLRALWDEALDKKLVAPVGTGVGAVQREYVATRLHEFSSFEASQAPALSDASLDFSSHQGREEDVGSRPPTPAGRTDQWLLVLWFQLSAIEAQHDALTRRRVLRPSGDLSAHDRLRFLARLLGPQASQWQFGTVSDDKLVETLLGLAVSRDLGSLTQAELYNALSDSAGAVAHDDATNALDQQVALALRLRQPPVPRNLLVQVAELSESSEALRLEAARVARQMGELPLARRLGATVGSAAARLEGALVALRSGERNEALAIAAELSGSAEAKVKGHALAILARAMLDEGQTEEALRTCASGPECAPLAETRALCLLAMQRNDEAERSVETGEALAETDEESARLSAVRGMLAHARGEPERAVACFERAVEQARAAGAALEEATYATGVAAAGSDAGRLDLALAASERAELLFEALRSPLPMARTVLARCSVLAAVGAEAELTLLVQRGLQLARRGGDFRCEGFFHLCLCDGLSDLEVRRSSARAAERLLEPASVEDRLRAAARAFSVQGQHDPEVAAWAQQVTQPEVLLEWWKAKADALLRFPPPAGAKATLASLAVPIVEQLELLGQAGSAGGARGPALVAGALLAERAGLAERAHALLQRASDAAGHFLAHVPTKHQRTARRLPWVLEAHGRRLGAHSSSAQLADVESLLRSLGRRDGFRGLLKQVLDMLLLWTEVERGLLLLRAPGGKLVVRAARNLDRRDLSEEQRRLSLTMAERAVQERHAVVAVDAMSDLPSIHRSVHALSLRSVLAVPLIARGEVLGVAYLDDRVKRAAFGAHELSWANLISTVAALAIADERDRLLLERALRRARRAEEQLSDRLQQKETALEMATRELTHIRQERKLRGDYSRIVHQSRAMQELLGIVDRVAQSDIPALICGESGTGKELIARAVAEAGPRRDKPFVAENCAAVPEGLMESTLFGHQRGAFTGASQNQDGLFVMAHRGTLFLDEIGEMSLALQSKLLRVLQEGQVRPLGASRSRPVDVRLLAATNRDLKLLVEEGRFREDLYYRLHVVQLNLPPLRERPEDIEALVRHFLRLHGDEHKTISKGALARLSSFSWPGNIRQLENEVRRMLVLGGDELTAADLSPEVLRGSEDAPQATTLREKVDALERRLLVDALEQTSGNRTRAAEILGLSRFGLQKMAQRLDIPLARAVQRSGRNRTRGLDDL